MPCWACIFANANIPFSPSFYVLGALGIFAVGNQCQQRVRVDVYPKGQAGKVGTHFDHSQHFGRRLLSGHVHSLVEHVLHAGHINADSNRVVLGEFFPVGDHSFGENIPIGTHYVILGTYFKCLVVNEMGSHIGHLSLRRANIGFSIDLMFGSALFNRINQGIGRSRVGKFYPNEKV